MNKQKKHLNDDYKRPKMDKQSILGAESSMMHP